MLLEVKLVNWRPFELVDPPVEFRPGINSLYGENGAGKSSFLDAIMYGLYGELPYNLADAVRRGKSYARVELKLRGLDGNTYQIQRTIRIRQTRSGERRGYTDSNATMIFFLDGTAVSGSEEVTEHVTRLLGVSSRLFSETLYIRQGELREILLKTGRRRAEYLDKLIGTFDLESCYRACATLVQWAEGNRNAFVTLKQSLESDVARLPELGAEAKENKERIENLKEKVLELRGRREEAGKEKGRLEEIRREIEKRESQLKVEEAYLEKIKPS